MRGDKIPTVRGNGWKIPLLLSKVRKKSRTMVTKAPKKTIQKNCWKLIVLRIAPLIGTCAVFWTPVTSPTTRFYPWSILPSNTRNAFMVFIPKFNQCWDVLFFKSIFFNVSIKSLILISSFSEVHFLILGLFTSL